MTGNHFNPTDWDVRVPYYYVAWRESDQPVEVLPMHERYDSLLYRVFRHDYEGDGETVSITEPMPKFDAIRELKKLKLLIGDGGRYEY
jgi:hypothetical protein